ncbi:MAG: hypothetical protein ACXV7G_12060 [Halobacteriota archaeon]
MIVAVLFVSIGIMTIGYFRFRLPLYPQYGKGGVGIISNGNYILTKSDFNEVICGSTEWRGLARSERQVITCKNSTVAEFNLADLFMSSFVIHFTPNRIYICDFISYSGGYYLRASD